MRKLSPLLLAAALGACSGGVNVRPWYTAWLYGDTADQITATVANGQLRVTAVSSDPNEIGDMGPPETGASETATRNAEEVLEACS